MQVDQDQVFEQDHYQSKCGRGRAVVPPAPPPSVCYLLARYLGVLLGDSVHQDRDHDGGDQRIGGQAPAARSRIAAVMMVP